MESLVIATHISIIIFTIFVVKVCCHLKNIGPVVGVKAWNDEYVNRIVGGEPASMNKFPWNVIIVNFGGVCGGTILTVKAVLTAAHCFDHNDKMEEMVVFANSQYLFDPKSIKYRVWEIKRHEKYNDGVNYSNDIAVLIVHNTFRYSDTVQKANLCNSDVWKSETKSAFIASGWGEIGYNQQMSPEGLMMTNMSLVSRERCLEMNQLDVLSPDMFCLHGDRQRDACRGDSGGSILWNGMVVGIVSHGKLCAEYPGVYINVFYHLSWIRNAVESLYDSYCRWEQHADIILFNQ